MNNFSKKISKSLLSNLITFDFVLLTFLNKRSSNNFSVKYKLAKKNYVVRLELLELLKTFKRFIRLFQFMHKFFNNANKIKTLLYIWSDNLQSVYLLNLFFKKYKIKFPITIKKDFPHKFFNFLELKSTLALDYTLNPNNYQSLFMRNFFLVQKINSFNESSNFGSFKIFNSLNVFKKVLFVGVVLAQIFKKEKYAPLK
jgi:hypothetical protein